MTVQNSTDQFSTAHSCKISWIYVHIYEQTILAALYHYPNLKQPTPYSSEQDPDEIRAYLCIPYENREEGEITENHGCGLLVTPRIRYQNFRNQIRESGSVFFKDGMLSTEFYR
jgi:hypothetical protein